MFYTTIRVRQGERAIITTSGTLQGTLTGSGDYSSNPPFVGLYRTLGAGKYTIIHFGSWYCLSQDWQLIRKFSYKINKLDNLAVDWEGVQNALRFQRELAEKCWRVIESAAGTTTLVWHKFLQPQAIPSGDIRAFWRPEPEDDDLNCCVIRKHEVWLPEDVQKQLFAYPTLHPDLHKFTVQPNHKLLILIQGRLDRILDFGQYVLYYPLESHVQTILVDTLRHMRVELEEITKLIDYQRDVIEYYEQAQHWLLVESPSHAPTVVWHERYLEPQIVPRGKAYLFWQPTHSPLQTVLLDKPAFRLPEDLKNIVLQQDKPHPDFKSYTVRAHEKLLVVVRGQLQAVYDMGSYVFYLPDDSIEIKLLDSRDPLFADTQQVQIWQNKAAAFINQLFDFKETGEHELLIYTVGDELTGWLKPNHRAYFWKQAALPYSTQLIDLKQSDEIGADWIARLKHLDLTQHKMGQIVHHINVPEQHEAVIWRERILQNDVLGTGNYYYWQFNQSINSKVFDLRVQHLETGALECSSKDKVALRVNAVCRYQITDVKQWAQLSDDFLSKEFQTAVKNIVKKFEFKTLNDQRKTVEDELCQMMLDKHIAGVDILATTLKETTSVYGQLHEALNRLNHLTD